MEALVVLLKTFFAGAGIGSIVALAIAMIKNRAAFKDEEKLSIADILRMVIIGFIVGGCIGTIYIK